MSASGAATAGTSGGRSGNGVADSGLSSGSGPGSSFLSSSVVLSVSGARSATGVAALLVSGCSCINPSASAAAAAAAACSPLASLVGGPSDGMCSTTGIDGGRMGLGECGTVALCTASRGAWFVGTCGPGPGPGPIGAAGLRRGFAGGSAGAGISDGGGRGAGTGFTGIVLLLLLSIESMGIGPFLMAVGGGGPDTSRLEMLCTGGGCGSCLLLGMGGTESAAR